jgi:hypothetical protein
VALIVRMSAEGVDRMTHVLKFAAVIIGCWSALSVVVGLAIARILHNSDCPAVLAGTASMQGSASLTGTAPDSKWDRYPANGVKHAPAVQPSGAAD